MGTVPEEKVSLYAVLLKSFGRLYHVHGSWQGAHGVEQYWLQRACGHSCRHRSLHAVIHS